MTTDSTAPPAPPDRRLRAARLSTFGFFGLNGFAMGMWVVHIPSIEDRAGISHAVLGWLLLCMGIGAFAGLQVSGPLSDRFGSRRTVPIAGVLCSASLVLPGLAEGLWPLGAALVVLGFGNGCLDVSMNTHAVQVERDYGRPVMSAFHAVFSIGGVFAAPVGARTISWGWSVPLTLACAAAFCVAACLLAAPALLPPEKHASTEAAPGAGAGAVVVAKRRTPSRVWALALLSLMLMLSEGIAYDWSVLHVQDVLDAPAATAAFAYGAFATAMTVGRLTTDRIVARFGPVFVVRYGAAVAAAGLTTAALSSWIPLAMVGWTVFGIGLSGCVPQFFTAAGNVDKEAAGANVSRVAGLGYLGMLAGPAVIGPMTDLVPLNLTFFLPVAFCVAAVFSAGILRPADRNGEPAGTPPDAHTGTEGAGPGPDADSGRVTV
ncbi:MAG TPA: MFS transporter [Streptomyces sp.]|nr:MFS transporter [Streptomyces sp.]